VPRRRTRNVSVLTADIIHSTHYSSRHRRQVDQVLRRSFKEVARKFPNTVHTPLAFRITAGDEFQCVFLEVPKTFDILTYLRASAATSKVRPIISFRASIGVGEISVSGKADPYEEDGQAFVRSRRGLEQLNRPRQSLTKIVTGQPELDRLADVILLLLDRLQKSWTVPQWEAIKWSLLGLTREEISKKLNVAHQNVTKRLLAAGWQQFREASELLREILTKAAQS
jgi:hypothetical protein